METENVFRIGEFEIEALGDRVIVLVDQFKSGYECLDCQGRGYNICTDCDGGKSRMNPNMVCKTCHGTVKVDCESCGGKGVEQGGIIVPETSQNRPESGTIVSIGEDVGRPVRRLMGVRVQISEDRVQVIKIGDKILFGRFSGNAIDLETITKEKILLRILNESEILCRMKGHMDLRRLRNNVSS